MTKNDKDNIQQQKCKELTGMEAVLELNQSSIDNYDFEGKVKVSSKGQVVIPIEIRRAMGIEEGNQELVFRLKDGVITVEVVRHLSAEELFGFFNQPEDEGNFVLDLGTAREERAQAILNKKYDPHEEGAEF